MINENYRCICSGDKLVNIKFSTRFVDDINDELAYYLDAESGLFVDGGHIRDEFSKHTDNEKLIDKVMERVCQRYGCEMVDDEMISDTPEQLLQAMMAACVYMSGF